MSGVATAWGPIMTAGGIRFRLWAPGEQEVRLRMDGTDHPMAKEVDSPGDAAFMPAGTIHASFNPSDGESRLLAVFGPSVGAGFDTIEMAAEAPWDTLRVTERVSG